MCLFGIPKDEDIVFVDRRAPRHKSTQIVRERRSHSSRPVSRISETVIRQHSHRPSTPMSEVHRHSTSMTEIHRGPHSHRHSSSMTEIHRGAPSHRHSSSMTEIHRTHTPAPPTPKPFTPVPPPASVAPPPPPPASVGFPPGYAPGYPPPPMSVAPPPSHHYIPPPSPSIMPASPAPSYRDLSPPRVPTPPEESRVELIKVEEEHWPPHSHGRSSPSAIHISRRKSRKGSVSSGRDRERDRGDREEIYIQRDRIIERGTPSRHPSSSPSSFARRGSRGSGTPEPVQSGYRTVEGTGWDDRRPITPSGYRVVDGAGTRRGSGVGIVNIHREREWEREKVSPSEFGGRRGSIPYDNGSIGRPRSSGRFAEREKVVMDEGGRRREMYRRA
ncbi:hypothetical protein BOTCAL_0478g00020 [Botryotinia calthae]|uniref:Uncharacterized protein n=1 Tax=Botryotinia calthae TaxID=38488 RepID=A0A4Y8CM27_9HELO|nr:hypothetical protein BOTCAL_0478g00020 [Botryotinia calthae]